MMKEELKICRYLRGKNAYGTMEGGGHPFLSVDPRTSVYWCLCTMGPVGPDDRPAHPSTCGKAERSCFAARPAEEEE